MRQGSEALQLDFDKEPKVVKKVEADIRLFKPEPNDNSEKEIARGYDKYAASGGILSQEEYRRVMKRAEAETTPNSMWSAHANSMARAAGITLSPETAAIYGILRDEKPDPEKKRYSELSDQKLLAEALLIIGDESSRSVFIEKHPHIFNQGKS
jgi:hypothetical protein